MIHTKHKRLRQFRDYARRPLDHRKSVLWRFCQAYQPSNQLFVVFEQNRHVYSMLRSLLPNLAGKSLLHFTEGRARVSAGVGPVNVRFHRDAGIMLRSCKVAIVAVRRPLTMLHLECFLMLPEAAATHGLSRLSNLCPISSLRSSSHVRS